MGGGTIFGFYGGTAVMKGDIELMGVPPLGKTLQNFVRRESERTRNSFDLLSCIKYTLHPGIATFFG